MSKSNKLLVEFTNGEFAKILRKAIYDPPENKPQSLKAGDEIEFLFNRVWYQGNIREDWRNKNDLKEKNKVRHFTD